MRVDDYRNAITLAAKDLAARDPKRTAELSGAVLGPEYLTLTFMNRPVKIALDGYTVSWADHAEEFALTDAVLVLHYLQGAKNLEPAGELTAYRQIPGGEFYTAAFRKRAELPLISVFGRRPGLLTQASSTLGGVAKTALGDEAFLFRVLPQAEIAVILHYGDEEFEPDGQVLFDRNMRLCFNIEDLAWLGSALVYRLMNAARRL
ncbi:MAG: DUF3786 domain-containing protein [Deltaproteobacteria bacterium]|nr:DUF3786 domain-containing protein [Deltaproteobacteria bacterium]